MQWETTIVMERVKNAKGLKVNLTNLANYPNTERDAITLCAWHSRKREVFFFFFFLKDDFILEKPNAFKQVKTSAELVKIRTEFQLIKGKD